MKIHANGECTPQSQGSAPVAAANSGSSLGRFSELHWLGIWEVGRRTGRTSSGRCGLLGQLSCSGGEGGAREIARGDGLGCHSRRWCCALRSKIIPQGDGKLLAPWRRSRHRRNQAESALPTWIPDRDCWAGKVVTFVVDGDSNLGAHGASATTNC